MSRGKKRADRIRASLKMTKVLEAYGYDVSGDDHDREQQFSCDLHGDGRDGKPSARYYPESNSVYCFACGRTRDAITWTMEKEGVKFSEACQKLERVARLPPLPWEDEDTEVEAEEEKIVLPPLDPATTYEDERARLHRNLTLLTQERELPLPTLLRLWEEHDKIAYQRRKDELDERQAKAEIVALRARVEVAFHQTKS